MDQNALLLDKFYRSVQNHDYLVIADCYHPNATFKGIAFDLREKKMIQAMWHMIEQTDLQVSYTVEEANESNGTALWVADYTFTDTGRRVHNKLRSEFTFKDGLIIRQVDDCVPWSWGMQALGPVKGFLSWLVPAIRRKKAMDKIQSFIKEHPAYQ